MYGLPEAHKTRRIKRFRYHGIPPPCGGQRKRTGDRREVSERQRRSAANRPTRQARWYFQLWRSNRVGGTAFLISVGVWGAPLPAAFVNSMLYNVLYKCDADESHNSKGALWWERTLGLPFFANRSGRVTASRGFLDRFSVTHKITHFNLQGPIFDPRNGRCARPKTGLFARP